MGGFNLADTSVTTSLKYGLNASAKRKPAKAPRAPSPRSPTRTTTTTGPRPRARVRANAEVARQQAAARDDARARALHAAALQQDASVFEYDAHHDAHRDVRREAQREADAERVDRESKYVETLIRGRDEREREDAVLRERRLVREREREDHLYGDKERFVTNAYKNKLKEDAAWLAEDTSAHEKDALAFSSAARRGFSVFFLRSARERSLNSRREHEHEHETENERNEHARSTRCGTSRRRNARRGDGKNGKNRPPRLETAATNGGVRGHVNGHERVTSKNSMPLKRTTMEKRSISETGTAETDTPAVAAVAAVAESANRAESAKALAARARFLERKRAQGIEFTVYEKRAFVVTLFCNRDSAHITVARSLWFYRRTRRYAFRGTVSSASATARNHAVLCAGCVNTRCAAFSSSSTWRCAKAAEAPGFARAARVDRSACEPSPRRPRRVRA